MTQRPTRSTLFPYTTLFRSNRKWCKKRGIRMTVARKGSKPKLTKYQKRKSRDEFNERNQIEGKFGQAKQGDRKSTRLNSSHVRISYAVFCLKKKIDNIIYTK